MLAACSAHFSKLFSNSTLNGQLIVILEGTHHQDLQILLQFMYKGVAYLHQDRIESVLRTAEVLQVCSLVLVCAQCQEEVKCDLITNLHSAIRQNSIRADAKTGPSSGKYVRAVFAALQSAAVRSVKVPPLQPSSASPASPAQPSPVEL